ncbi:hypothetical protein [Nocardia brasiliensis]|uniref:hypothetical protein n=1 Tax=Nocardia brasiliensis TaxID=37326 RepID=UPI0024547619|nr:hypothetical protein [Nocardia brasiliensis]
MTNNTPPQRIPCRYADGTPVPEAEADMIMRALGFSSAREAERIIGDGEQRRRARSEQATGEFDRWDEAHAILAERGVLTGNATADARRITRYLTMSAA